MTYEGSIFRVKHLFCVSVWKCFLRYMRGIWRLSGKRYEESFQDFQWNLNNCENLGINNLVYKHLGIICARQENYEEAENYLLKASSLKRVERDGELFMWLGYVFMVKQKYPESLDCFRKANKLGQRGLQKYFVQHEYVKDHINKLEDHIKETYKEIITFN